ncbi:unnamed protein product [Euphydryas editha]|uniref:PDZ domain-containing protein n=1 Tax=Euphydryas editha TaxID=104508 RepID=A0AAU9V312_EUPED|nr:unnamed protein product [Euphydryas editha]
MLKFCSPAARRREPNAVNPGRKASLSGIREGDVITSINGKQTKDMSNADAHAMLRSAGPVLRLGLNEDRELSPRRRSIGKSTELKRPSQLISEISSGRATPQAPVYATIRPPQSPHNKLSSPIRSLNSSLSTLNSTPLVKSVASSEEPLKFHPTNPFYSTLPNYTSTSKLPIPNGKTANVQPLLYNRSINRSTDSYNKNSEHDLKLSSFFSKKFDSDPSSIPNANNDDHTNKSFETTSPKSFTTDKYNSFSNTQEELSEFSQNINNEDHVKNPFKTVTDGNFSKKYNSSDKINGTSTNGSKQLFYSKSDGDFRCNEEVIKHSSITEKKINQIEEIKTIKKITLNGSTENDHNQTNGVLKDMKSAHYSTKERIIPTTLQDEDLNNSKISQKENSFGRTRTQIFQSPSEKHNVGSRASASGHYNIQDEAIL